MASPDPLLSPTRVPLLDEKGMATPATKSSEESPPPTPASPTSPVAPRGHTELEGAMSSLIWGAFAPCVPVAVVTSVLLTAILYHRIPNEFVFVPLGPKTDFNTTLSTLSSFQQIENNGGSSAYYLYYNHLTNPAVLHMISSWTAKIIPFVTGASMALVAFFAGQRIIKATKAKSEKLPSPHQVSILIGLLNGGGAQPLMDTIVYRYKNHEDLVQPLPLAFWCLSFIVFMTFAIGAVDSWFGTATTALNIALVTPANGTTFSFGRSLNSTQCPVGAWHARQCPSNPQGSCLYPCSITNWTTTNGEREGVVHAQEAAETLMSNSRTNTIFNVTVDGSNYFFLGDLKSNMGLDYATKTLAVTTQCHVQTQECDVPQGGGFTCGNYTSPSFSYSGEVGLDPINATSQMDEAMVGIQFFQDSGLSQPIGNGSTATDLFTTHNAMNFLTWSKGFPPQDTYKDEFIPLRNKGYLKNDTNGDTVFILGCQASISQVEYYYFNGSVVTQNFKVIDNAPDYWGAVFSAPFAINTALSHLALQDAAALAAYQTSPDGISYIFSDYFSRAAVAFSSGISVPFKNDLEWNRDNTYLATRVPYAPLYTLVALKAVYAIFALSLAVLAVFRTHPSQAHEVKERLTVDGLAAGFFEPNANHERAVKNVQDLFKEHHSPDKSEDTQKIGLLQTDQGGWLWVTAATKVVAGLGLTEVVQTVADQAADAASKRKGTLGSVGEGYRLVKDII